MITETATASRPSTRRPRRFGDGMLTPVEVLEFKGRATVTGVGFFDIPHGQTGVAPNAIELHPVLKFLASSCSH